MLDRSPRDLRSPRDAITSLSIQSLSTPIPAPVSSMIGRDRDAAFVLTLVHNPSVRLITLTGPGGVGKTRLALHIARIMQTESPDDVAYVELASLRDAQYVAHTIAQTLGIRLSAEKSAQQRLVEALQPHTLLLILDNLEHLFEAGSILRALLASCPRLTILATSRSVLNVSGEHVFPIAPLSWKRFDDHDDRESTAIASSTPSDAEQLFIERARAADPWFSGLYGDSEVIAEICARLDGLPLAIEMAAARVYLLTPEELLARLYLRLPILTGAARDLPERQQTMRDAIAWSYDLLDPEEQAVLRRLSVFLGAWSLDAAAAVCWDPSLDKALRDVACLPVIESLVRKSVVTRVTPTQRQIAAIGPRFRLLETIREFTEVELFKTGELEEIRERHARYYASEAVRLEPMLWGDEPGNARSLISLGLGNYRAALDWARGEKQTDIALRIVGAIFDPESTQDLARLLGQDILSQLELVQRALAMPGGSDDARSAALCKASHLADVHGDNALALLLGDEAVERARKSGNAIRLGNAAFVRGRHTFFSGDPAGGRQWLEIASNIYQQEGARGRLAWTQCMLASIECIEAPIHAGQCNPGLLSAAERCDAALATFRKTEHTPGISRALGGRAYVAYKQGDWTLSLSLLHDLLVAALDEGRIVPSCVEDIADIAGRTDRPELAARLYGAIEEDRRTFGRVVPPIFRDEVAAEIAAVRNLLGDAGFAREFEIGRATPIEQAVVEALAFAADAVAPAPVQLTSREREVLALIVEDLSAQEMADRLYLSRRTVETHLANLYAKLDAHSRAEALAAAQDRALLSND